MKSTILWTALLVGTSASAMTVKEKDIAGKTDQVTIADTVVNGKKETILADAKGFSLYTFQADTAGHSNCSGTCLKEWPPQHVPAWRKSSGAVCLDQRQRRQAATHAQRHAALPL